MTVYRVNARRSGEWWALDVPDLPGVFSQSKRLEKAEDAAREAIALMLDVDPDTVQVTVEPQIPAAALKSVAAADKARREAEEAATRAQVAMEEAAEALTAAMSQRDAGQLLKVSFQRVSQLVAAKRRRVDAQGKAKASGAARKLKEAYEAYPKAPARRGRDAHDPKKRRADKGQRLSA
ncbi:type II toxin-antitoxin system HicB family antitoxin [Streptomyces sp. NPDC058745]|uniref:type II toxin-antitoxin system HicB family antitoxin n=1 Tax=Streptomyces sp. NPDC058745 TaxID=3346621 RepID=UPI00368DD8DD